MGLQCLREQGGAGHAGRREVVPARVAPTGETGDRDPVRDWVKVPENENGIVDPPVSSSAGDQNERGGTLPKWYFSALL